MASFLCGTEKYLESCVTNSAIHKEAGLTVPSHSMISTATIPVEQKSVHWLSMGAVSLNGLWGDVPAGGFLGTAGN